MASKVILFALMLVAIVGMAAAAKSTDAANASAPSSSNMPAAQAPITDDTIGNDDGPDAAASPTDVVAGPMGSSFVAGGPAAEAPKAAAATALEFSAAVGAIAVVAAYFF